MKYASKERKASERLADEIVEGVGCRRHDVCRASVAEVPLNADLQQLDALVMASVKDRDLTTPPVSPAEGDRYLVAASATDDWVGMDGYVAAYYSGWQFYEPKQGWILWVDDEDLLLLHDGSSWTVPHVTGLRVATAAAPAASALGTVTRKIEVKDAGGAVLGYLPLYDAIT